MKYYEKIRNGFVKGRDEKIKAILLSGLGHEPRFEEFYEDILTGSSVIREIYRRWVLNSVPPHIPTKEDLYKLSDELIEAYKERNNERKESIIWLFTDILWDSVNVLVVHGLKYYDVSVSDPVDYIQLVRTTLFRSLVISTRGDNEEDGYIDFVVGVSDRFRWLLFSNLQVQNYKMPENDDDFLKSFSSAWQEVLNPLYTDFYYGFSIFPKISLDDFIRFLELPFNNRKYKSLSKSAAFHQVMTYLLSLATFKPMPDIRKKKEMFALICYLYEPLIDSIIKELDKKKEVRENISDKAIRELAREEIRKCLKDFRFFFATEEGGIKQNNELFYAPTGFRGQGMALGNISKGNEFPFSCFVKERVKKKILTEYLPSDNELNGDSEILYEDKKYESFIGIPNYDFTNDQGEKIGWLRNTFAGILGISEKTLRRWDSEGLLVAKRGGYYKKHTPYKKIGYRYYTEGQIRKAREVKELKLNRKRHKL